MSAWKLTILVLALWMLLRFWLHPLLVRHWKGSDVRAKVMRAGSLAAVEMGRNLLARVLLLLSAILLFIWVCDFFGGSNTVLPQTLINLTANTASYFSSVQSVALDVITVLTVVGAGYVLYRTARTAKERVRGKLLEHIESVQKQLAADPAQVERLAADPEFSKTFEELRLLTERRHLLTSPEENPSPESRRETKTIDEAIAERTRDVVLRQAFRTFKVTQALTVTSDAVQKVRPRGFKERFLNFIGSTGAAKDLGFVRKNLERLATVFLVVSLLSWSSEAMANSLSLAATNLQVVFDKREAERVLGQALSSIPPTVSEPQAIPANDTVVRVSRTLARELTSNLVRRDLPYSLRLSSSGGARYENESIRLAVLDSKVSPADGGNPENLVRAESLTNDINAKGVNRQGERIADIIATKIQPQLAQIRDREPGLWLRITQYAEQRYSTPMDLWDAQQKLLGTAIGQVFDASEIESGSEVAKQAQKIVNEFGHNALTTWVDGHVQNYLSRVILESVGQQIPLHPSHTLPVAINDDSKALLQHAGIPEGVGTEPLHTVRTVDVTGEDRTRQALLGRLNSASREPLPPEIRQTILGYDALFPGTTRTMEQAVSTSAERVALGGLQAIEQSATFLKAARGGRARGVVIGRTAGGRPPRLSDISWLKSSATLFQLNILPATSNEWRQLGVFDAGLVNQALRYAADQRVVAVTMVDGAPFANLAVQLHPELLDTPLGCRVITLDRFVDTLDGSIPKVAQHRAAIDKLRVLMNVIVQRPTEICAPDKVARVPSGLAAVLSTHVSPPARFIESARRALGSDTASVAALDAALECSGQGTSSDMMSCACRPRSAIQSATSLFVANDVTSQVRERAFTPDSDFSWAAPTTGHLGDLEFWLHMTLDRETVDGRPVDASSAGNTLAVDFTDEDLTALNQGMPELVRRYLVSPDGLNTGYEDFMRPIEDFVTLQRFFRLALNGQFGEAFPLSKLVTLERETRPFVQKQITLRWQAFTEQQQRRLAEWAPTEYELLTEWDAEGRRKDSCNPL